MAVFLHKPQSIRQVQISLRKIFEFSYFKTSYPENCCCTNGNILSSSVLCSYTEDKFIPVSNMLLLYFPLLLKSYSLRIYFYFPKALYCQNEQIQCPLLQSKFSFVMLNRADENSLLTLSQENVAMLFMKQCTSGH